MSQAPPYKTTKGFSTPAHLQPIPGSIRACRTLRWQSPAAAQGERGSRLAPQPGAPEQSRCRGAVGTFQGASAEQDLQGILESRAGWPCPHCTASQEGFPLLHLEQL